MRLPWTMSVCAKSSPLKSKGSLLVLAKAYAQQSPKQALAAMRQRARSTPLALGFVDAAAWSCRTAKSAVGWGCIAPAVWR